MSENLAQQIENEIRAARLPLEIDCAWLDEVVWPHYGGLSINNIPATVAGMLGVDLPASESTAPRLDTRLWPSDTRVKRVVQILLDGFGYNLLQELRAEPEIGAVIDEITGGGVLAPLTSIFPSTTAVALSTLWTGATPATHGILGTRMFLREYGVLMSPLSLGPIGGRGDLTQWGLDPETLVPTPGIAEILDADGVNMHLVMLSYLPGSGLSRLLHRGVNEQNIHRTATFTDTWAALGEVLATTRDERCCISVYWGGLDAVSHKTGARSRRALAEARAQLRGLRDLIANWPADDGETALFVLADHGHLDIDTVIDTADHPRLADTFRIPFAAEGRARTLFVREGMRATAEAYLHNEFSDSMMVLDAQAALQAGLFGTGDVYTETPARAGDLLAICRDGAALYDPIDHYRYKSQHGGLAADEMLVPLIARIL